MVSRSTSESDHSGGTTVDPSVSCHCGTDGSPSPALPRTVEGLLLYCYTKDPSKEPHELNGSCLTAHGAP
jgi:hypothetical protein